MEPVQGQFRKSLFTDTHCAPIPPYTVAIVRRCGRMPALIALLPHGPLLSLGWDLIPADKFVPKKGALERYKITSVTMRAERLHNYELGLEMRWDRRWLAPELRSRDMPGGRAGWVSLSELPPEESNCQPEDRANEPPYENTGSTP